MSFLLNEGKRLFAPGGDIALSGRPMAGGAGDFDGDGKVDLAVCVVTTESCLIDFCDPTGGVSLLMNGGEGRFREVFTPAWVSAPILPCDLDGDGDLDLLVGGYALLNDGRGGMESTASFFGGMIAADLDGDGLPDVADVLQGSLSIAYARFGSPSPDQDRDGVPDECGAAPFRRGDTDADGGIGLTDAVFLSEHLFRGGPAAACEKASDANDDGRVDITDPVSLLEHLFRGGPAPPAPHAACGLDPTPDALACEAHAPCG